MWFPGFFIFKYCLIVVVFLRWTLLISGNNLKNQWQILSPYCLKQCSHPQGGPSVQSRWLRWGNETYLSAQPLQQTRSGILLQMLWPHTATHHHFPANTETLHLQRQKTRNSVISTSAKTKRFMQEQSMFLTHFLWYLCLFWKSWQLVGATNHFSSWALKVWIIALKKVVKG